MSLRKLLTLFIVLMALGTTSSWASCTRLSSPTVMLDMVVGRVVVPPDLPVGSVVLAGGQVLVGLFEDRVVYYQTYPLVPDVDGEFQAYLDGDLP